MIGIDIGRGQDGYGRKGLPLLQETHTKGCRLHEEELELSIGGRREVWCGVNKECVTGKYVIMRVVYSLDVSV